MASIRFRFDLSIEPREHNSANKRGTAMTWEDDELSAYEKNKARAIDNNKLASQRTQLLDNSKPINGVRFGKQLRNFAIP